MESIEEILRNKSSIKPIGKEDNDLVAFNQKDESKTSHPKVP